MQSPPLSKTLGEVIVGRACFARPARLALVAMKDATPLEDVDPHAALLARYASGDPAAARALTAQVTPRIYAHAIRVLGDTGEAEDVVQDAMMRLWRIAPDWRAGEAKVTTWLYRVVANLCTDRLRKRVAEPVETVELVADDAPNAARTLQDRARHDALQSALSTLPDRQRQAVVMRHIDGLSNPEIASVLDVGIEAVESLTARGKRALKLALAGQRDALGYEDDG